jgi:hypothetical protein
LRFKQSQVLRAMYIYTYVAKFSIHQNALFSSIYVFSLGFNSRHFEWKGHERFWYFCTGWFYLILAKGLCSVYCQKLFFNVHSHFNILDRNSTNDEMVLLFQYYFAAWIKYVHMYGIVDNEPIFSKLCSRSA